jgi:hypothetical protein
MKKLKTKYFRFQPIIGIGYWRDNYDFEGFTGYADNIILPFMRIQFSCITIK